MTATLPLSTPPVAAAHKQVEQWLRRQIFAQAYPVGERIPTVKELSAQLGASTHTVTQAMDALVADGLLTRKRRSGTVVRNNRVTLRGLAIYGDLSFRQRAESDFIRRLSEEARILMAERNVTVGSWYGSESFPGGNARPPEDLAEAVAARRVQAIFVTQRREASQAWIDRLGIPAAIISSAERANGVYLDNADFANKALDALARRGCKRAGLIGAVSYREYVRDRESAWESAYARAFVAGASARGLRVAPEWVRLMAVPSQDLTDTDRERFGYEAMRALWGETEKPDGLVVTPDVIARGVAMAMASLDVRGLWPVFHRNEGIGLFAPFPYTAVEISPRRLVTSAVEMIDRQLRGLAPERVLVPYATVE